jgi:hypothetical protein
MTKDQDSSAGNTGRNPNPDCFCGTVRDAFDKLNEAFVPPENVRRHFREARVQVLMGIREIINNQIEHLNRTASKGARVVVD